MNRRPNMIEYPDCREWFIDGQELTEEEFNAYRFLIWVEQGPLVKIKEKV